MLFASRLWKGQKHYLDKMTLGELVRAYFAYPAIQVYLALTLAAAGGALYLMESPWPLFAAVAVVPFVYALVWFLLHRYVLHGRWLYKSPKTAALWKRIHFDHHSDPNDLGVLFGALPTTLPTILLITGPVGGLIGAFSTSPTRRGLRFSSASRSCTSRIISATKMAITASRISSGIACSAPTTRSPIKWPRARRFSTSATPAASWRSFRGWPGCPG